MTELTSLSATRLSSGIRNKQFSCKEIMQAYLSQITTVNPQLNAIVQQLDHEKAIKLAEQADLAVANKQKIGKLHGIPITIKDHLKVKDFIISRGCHGLKENRCTEDASLVTRLKQEGAIIIGITNMPELGPAFEANNFLYGKTNNPYDLTRTSGGSSGGEAAIIASGGSALGIGSDGGGSIRVPAHFCGIAGLKPSQHLISCCGNVPSDGGVGMLFSTVGPMARFVEDLRLSLPILAGWDGIDPHVMPLNLPINTKPIEEMRIGFLIKNSQSTLSDDTIQVMQDAINLLKNKTNKINEVDFLDIAYLGKFHWDTFFAGGDRGNSYRLLLNKLNTTNISTLLTQYFEVVSTSEIYDATEIRRRFFEADQLRMQALQHMKNYDVIIMPSCATPAKFHGTTFDHLHDFVYTLAINLLGWPGCVVRCGTSKEGLPIGLQIIANPWHDYDTLTVAEYLESKLGGWQAPAILS